MKTDMSKVILGCSLATFGVLSIAFLVCVCMSL